MQDRLYLIRKRKFHSRAAKEHDHDLLSGLCKRPDQLQLVLRQAHIRPVTSLALYMIRKPREYQHCIISLSALYSLPDHPKICFCSILSVPRDIFIRELSLFKGVFHRCDPGGMDHGAPCSLITHFLKQLPCDKDLFPFFQRKYPVVFQEHCRILRRPGRQCMVCFPVHGLCFFCPCISADPFQDIPYCLIQNIHGQLPLPDSVQDPSPADGSVPRHFQVQTCFQAFHPVVHSSPVSHDNSVKSPLFPEHLCQKPSVFRTVRPVDLIVGAHHGRRSRLLNDLFKGFQVNLPCSALVHDAVAHKPIVFTVVQSEMLHRDTHSLGLHAPDLRRAHGACQERIFGKILKIPAAQRVPLDVHSGSEKDMHAIISALFPDGLPDPARSLRVP